MDEIGMETSSAKLQTGEERVRIEATVDLVEDMPAIVQMSFKYIVSGSDVFASSSNNSGLAQVSAESAATKIGMSPMIPMPSRPA